MQLDLFKAYKTRDAITFGEMWVRALNSFISPHMYDGDYLTVEEWQPFGDPTLAIAEESNPPEKPTLSGPSQGKPGEEYAFEAKAVDPDGDRCIICLIGVMVVILSGLGRMFLVGQ